MTALFLAIAALTGANEAAFEEFFEDFRARREGIENVTAAFTRESIYGEDRFVEEGQLVYVKPRRLILCNADPESTLLLDGYTMYEYLPEVEQVEVHELKRTPQSDVLFFGFDDNPEALMMGYDVELIPAPDAPEGQGLRIRPKPEEVEDAFFQEMELYLRGEDYLPYRIVLHTDEESRTEYDISGFKVNQELDPSERYVALKPGTTIVEDDEIVKTVGAGGMLIPVRERQQEAAPEAAERRGPVLRPLVRSEDLAPAGEAAE